MVISLGRIVGRRVFAESFPGGLRTYSYLRSSFQNRGIREKWIDRGTWILSVVIGGIGGWCYSARADAESNKRLEAGVHARYLRHTEAVDKEMLEVWDEYKAKEGILARLEEDCTLALLEKKLSEL